MRPEPVRRRPWVRNGREGSCWSRTRSLLRGLIAQFLRGEGFEVVEAADGREGVERFSEPGPVRPCPARPEPARLPGVEVCRRIKLRATPAAGHHLQRGDPRRPHRGARGAGGRPVPHQALPSRRAAEPDRHRARTGASRPKLRPANPCASGLVARRPAAAAPRPRRIPCSSCRRSINMIGLIRSFPGPRPIDLAGGKRT